MYKPEIAIIIPTIYRDDLLMKCIESIIEHMDMDKTKIFIIDQNNFEYDSEEKRIFYETACARAHTYENRQIEVIRVPFNSGISYCRNVGVQAAYEQQIPYCIISADSIVFNQSMNNINDLIIFLERCTVDLIGLKLENRIPWEAKLNLIEKSHFEIEYITKIRETRWATICDTENRETYYLWECDIVKNFFIAKTSSLMQTGWDRELLMAEHEDFFWRFKQNGFKVVYSESSAGIYIGENSKKDGKEYSKLRQGNWQHSLQKLKEKYNLKKWIGYKNKPNE